MVSFQKDIFLTINTFHENYLEKINTLFRNEDLLNQLSIDSANDLVNYIKEYKNLINSAGLIIEKINNIKNAENLNDKIEKELMIKIIPVMNVYRTLLLEKYSKPSNPSNPSNINEQD